jgi:hypothetical protein
MSATNGHNSNGHNGHNDHDLDAQLDLDLLEDDPEVVRPCSERLGYGSWCFLPDGHDGNHEGVPPVYGPVEERPRLWREHKGYTR